MIKRRAVLASMATVPVVAGLAACGGSSDGNTGASGGGKSLAPAPEGEKVELTYMHRLPDGEGMTKVQDIVKRWNDENPNIQVKAVKFDGKAQEMGLRLENEIKTGTAPDLAQAGYAEVPEWFTKGMLEDVTQEAEKYKGNYAAGAYALVGVGESVFGLPQDTGPLVYFYNEEEFKKLGLEVPTNSEELLDVAKKAKAKGKFALSFQPDETLGQMSGQAAAAGAVWYTPSDNAWKVEVTGEETMKLAEFWQQVIDADATLTEQRWSDGFKKALVDGNLIGTIGAAWEAALIAGDLTDAASAGKWKIAQLPALGEKTMSGPDGGSGVVVLKGSKYPVEAMKFNDWFNSQVEDLASQGLVVASTGAVKTPEALTTFFGGQDVMAELSKANEIMSQDFVYLPAWSAVGDPMIQAGDAAANKKGDVAAIFEAAQEASVKALKDKGLPVNE